MTTRKGLVIRKIIFVFYCCYVFSLKDCKIGYKSFYSALLGSVHRGVKTKKIEKEQRNVLSYIEIKNLDIFTRGNF